MRTMRPAKTCYYIKLDNTVMPASDFQAVGSSTYVVARKSITEGSHTIHSDKPMGIVVYGWDSYVSYGYPGGMNIESIYVH